MADIFDMADEWTDVGTTYTAIKMNVTDTASAAASLLMDLQVGGSSKFRVTKAGGIHFAEYLRGDTNILMVRNGTTIGAFLAGGLCMNAKYLAIGVDESTPDVLLNRDAANTLAQRNGTNAQAFRIYNTYTDASNYERGGFTWSSNILELRTEKAGTGQDRDFWLRPTGKIYLTSNSGGGAHWQIDNGHFVAGADNTYDIGASGATRPRTGYFGTSVVSPRLLTPTSGELTIATGAITATGSYHTVDTEGDAASDDLDTINGGSDGAILVIRAADGARTVVAKDGTGNLQLEGDCSLDNAQDTLTLIYVGALTAWLEIARSNNGA